MRGSLSFFTHPRVSPAASPGATVLSPAGAGSEYGSRLRLRLRRGRRLRLTKDINIFLTAFGRVKSGLKPAVKNRAMHGGEECAARMVKTKADALGIGGQTPISAGAGESSGGKSALSS